MIFAIGMVGINLDEDICTIEQENRAVLTTGIIANCVAVGLGCAIPAWCDEADRIFVQEYLAQKYTIEMSLDNEDLSGLEKIELVKLATELNGELAREKAQFDIWYCVHYDYTIFDDVELIDLGG